jgi:type 1 glutamine amidotransferase
MVKHLLSVCVLAASVAVLSAPAWAEDVKPIKALLITGGNAHDYKGQAKILTEGLSAKINIEWTIEHPLNAKGGEMRGDTAIDIYKKPDWIKGYDVVVHNECYAEVMDKDFVESIAKAHSESGVAAVIIHGTLHAYRGLDKQTDAWRLLLGVTSVRHEKGGATLEVKPVKADHPIMLGLPESWKTPNEELYVIAKEWPQLVPLAKCQSAEDATKSYTTIWVNTCGKAKVFGTSIGHSNATFKIPTFMDVMARGVLWACDKLDDKGQPKPGYGPKRTPQ